MGSNKSKPATKFAGNKSPRGVIHRKKNFSNPNKSKINSVKKTVDGIEFKSLLEVSTYRHLKEAGIAAIYEGKKFIIHEGSSYPSPCFESSPSGTFSNRMGKKILDITYTPDFIGVDSNGNLLWVIECKGFANERFPYIWKLFKKHLINTNQACPLFLPKSVSQVKEVIQYLKDNPPI